MDDLNSLLLSQSVPPQGDGMELAFHLGVPFTDNDALIWSLRRDRFALADAGIAVPRPRFFRDQLNEITRDLHGRALPSEEQADFLVRLSSEDTRRVVLSDPNFLCWPANVFAGGAFYGRADLKSSWLRNTFADQRGEFFMGLCNPATFLSALLKHQSPSTLDDIMADSDPEAMLWSDVILRIREANPGTPLTIWCNEDTPLNWPLILAAVAGIEPDVPLAGADYVTRPLLTAEGQASLSTVLGDPIAAPLDATLNALADHLERFADPEAVDAELALPGWDEAFIDDLTDAYEEDLVRIAGMEGVVFIDA